MLSKRTLTLLSIVVVSLVLLALTSRSLQDWSVDSDGYTHIPGHGMRPPPPHPPHSKPHDDAESNGHNGPIDHNGPAEPPTGHSETNETAHGLPATEDIPFRPHDPVCDNFPDTSKVLVVMKTGATESYNKIPTQVITLLRCLPEYFIFSDHDEVIAGHHIRDSLDTVLEETRLDNNDFTLYNRQKECAIDQETCNKLAANSKEGWNLDKYKNVHIAEKVYKLRPDYDWYLFIDADTYVLFPTLMQWLPTLDHTKPHYLGSVTMLKGYSFAHGGSGYLVSQPAMKAIGEHPGIANELEPIMRKECCGDYVFGVSLDNTSSTRVRNMWPTINGEKPFTLPYGPNHWCHPLVTMHHMNSEEISTFWEWEVKRYAAPDAVANPPITRIKDVFEAFVKSRLVPFREDWDNKADDRFYLVQEPNGRKFSDWELKRTKKKGQPLSEVEQRAHDSPDACRAVCDEQEGCFAWRWQDGLCGISWKFRMGNPVKKADRQKERFISGWNMQRIQEFVDEMEDCNRPEAAFPKVP